MKAPYDYLIVGSGLFGATFAHLMHQRGRRCLVVEKRAHTGGNVHCETVCGIQVHQYGAHIFHTSDEAVWRFANALVPFNRYTNSPVANYKGRLFNLPFNMNTFHQMWGIGTPEEARRRIDAQRQKVIGEMKAQGVVEPRNLEEQALMLVGRDLYECLVKEYTEKQWGRPCSQLPAFIIKRLPVRFVYDNNYFNDARQGIPVGGYNRLVDRLLEGVEVRLNTDFLTNRDALSSMAAHVVYTGPVDAYFNHCYGTLEYRSVRFEQEVLQESNHQGCAVVNYTSHEVPYTRVIEHKHFEAFGDAVYRNPCTVISREYSDEWKPGMEPYYPVNDARNTALLERYRCLAQAERRVTFGGRLAEYKYYDMAPVMRQAIDLAKRMY